MGKKRKRLPATVEKVIEPIGHEPEKAQIAVQDADELYREIRIENVLIDEKGKKSRLKEGDEVDVTVEADSDATTKKSSS